MFQIVAVAGGRMKARDSGMPDEGWWRTFFDPEAILRALGLDRVDGLIVDVGSGYGTFTLPIARLTGQRVIGLDCEPELVAVVQAQARNAGLDSITIQHRDVFADGIGVDEGSAAVVLLFNILHCEDPVDLLRQANRALRPTGRVGIIHWRCDTPTPRGPELSIRPRPEQLDAWARSAGLIPVLGPVILPPYHVGMVVARPTLDAPT